MCCPHGNARSLRFVFAAIYHSCVTVSCTLSSRFFPRFADARVPVKVLKVGWSISVCRVECGEVDWYKANFRL